MRASADFSEIGGMIRAQVLVYCGISARLAIYGIPVCFFLDTPCHRDVSSLPQPNEMIGRNMSNMRTMTLQVERQ